MSKTEKSKPTYRRNPSWNVVYEDNLLVLNAGADKIFAIEDVSTSVGSEIVNLWASNSLNLDVLSREAKDIFEQLKTAQVVLNDIELKTKPKVSLKYAGDKDMRLDRELKALLAQDFELTTQLNYNFLIIVRTNERLRDVVTGNYGTITTPHLFVDVAFEHTISLGPLVFPGETACISCLVGRLTTYWGDAEPPMKAGIQSSSTVIAGLVAMEVRKILSEYGRELVNNTIAYDFENHKVTKNSIYRLPMCPVCSISTIDNPGAIKLPWVQTK